MNAMTQALKESGVKLPPVKQRIWTWLKDHPDKTIEDVTKALGFSYSLGAQMLDMERAGLLKVYGDVSRAANPVTGYKQKIKRFSAVGTEYVKPERRASKKPVNPTIYAMPEPYKKLTFKAHEEKPSFDPEALLRGLSLTDCKALYVYLHGVFK